MLRPALISVSLCLCVHTQQMVVLVFKSSLTGLLVRLFFPFIFNVISIVTDPHPPSLYPVLLTLLFVIYFSFPGIFHKQYLDEISHVQGGMARSPFRSQPTYLFIAEFSPITV